MELFRSGYGLLAAVFVLGAAVFVHELGHFLSAKLSRMRVEEFAFGFGPAIASIRRGETAYSIRAVPFGGFVRIAGMEPGHESLVVENGFYTRPRYQQLAVLFVGPAMNVLLGAAVFVLIFSVWGLVVGDISPPVIDRVTKGSPAEQAGLVRGDQIEAVDGQRLGLEVASVAPGTPAHRAGLRAGDVVAKADEVRLATLADLEREVAKAHRPLALEVYHRETDRLTGGRTYSDAVDPRPRLPAIPVPAGDTPNLAVAWGLRFGPLTRPDVTAYIQDRPGTPIHFAIRRPDGSRGDLAVTPASIQAREEYKTESGKTAFRWVRIGQIGVVFQAQRTHPSLPRAALIGLRDSASLLKDIVVGLWAMASGRTAVQVAGPLGMMAMAAESAKLGLEAVLQFLGMISINLAIVNLLPLPITDGGRALIVSYEGIVRRRVGRRQEIALVAGGVAVVVLLAVSITLQDIINLARHGSP